MLSYITASFCEIVFFLHVTLSINSNIILFNFSFYKRSNLRIIIFVYTINKSCTPVFDDFFFFFHFYNR